MLVCKQMITAVLIIAIALAAESKLKFRIGKLSATTYYTSMLSNWCTITILGTWWCSLSPKFSPSSHFLWIEPDGPFGHQIENAKVQKRHDDWDSRKNKAT